MSNDVFLFSFFQLRDAIKKKKYIVVQKKNNNALEKLRGKTIFTDCIALSIPFTLGEKYFLLFEPYDFIVRFKKIFK